ncbi:MAG: hypothetical protein QG656_2466, partial [Candidatus Hydrogenedentes bacterium]|nr:hypothetical protein [Candidatus Hydrogenedentota bacterium]
MACRIGRWVLVCAAVCLAAGGAVAADRFPALADVGDVFRFAICADPQVGHADDPGTVAANARRTQMLAVEELNAMEPKP